MSKNVAVIDADGAVVAINVQADEYTPQADEVEVTGVAWCGGDYVGGVFYPPQPFPSWSRGDGEWLPPTPQPTEGRWRWDEDTLTWVEVTA